MIATLSSNDLACCSALLDAVLGLEGIALHEALSNIVSSFLGRPGGRYFSDVANALNTQQLLQSVVHEGVGYGHYIFPDPAESYTEAEAGRLISFAALTGRMLQNRADTEKRSRALDQIESKLEQQAQILNQMHESVITMDQAGFITSWNRGAEQLFGYTAIEAIGRNVLFLYENEDEDDASHNEVILAQG